MNKDDQIDYPFVRQQILILLDVYREKLDKKAVDEIHQYTEYGEYEMAYEGLFIELMGSLQFCPKDIDIDLYMNIGEILGLNKESVFYPRFWEWFREYVDKYTNGTGNK